MKELELSEGKFATPAVELLMSTFRYCFSMTKLDVSGITTENVTNMHCTFASCESLKSLDISHWKTPSLTYVGGTFELMYSLEGTLDCSGFDTSEITGMNRLFRHLHNIEKIILTGFDCTKVTNMGEMFNECYKLKEVEFPEVLETPKCTTMYWMFRNCYSLEEIDCSSFRPSAVTDMSQMFANCMNLRTANLSGWTLKSGTGVVNMSEMFYADRRLETVYVGSGWQTSTTGTTAPTVNPAIKPNDNMFLGCINIVGADGTHYQNTATNPGSSSYAKVGGTGDPASGARMLTGSTTDGVHWNIDGNGTLILEPVNKTTGIGMLPSYMASVDTTIGGLSSDQALTPTDVPWYACRQNIKAFRIERDANGDPYTIMANGGIAGFFCGASNLTDVDLSGFDTSRATYFNKWFRDCSSLQHIDFTGINTSNVISMKWMFYGCTALEDVTGMNFSNENLLYIGWLFNMCNNLKSLDLPTKYGQNGEITQQFGFSKVNHLWRFRR